MNKERQKTLSHRKWPPLPIRWCLVVCLTKQSLMLYWYTNLEAYALKLELPVPRLQSVQVKVAEDISCLRKM